MWPWLSALARPPRDPLFAYPHGRVRLGPKTLRAWSMPSGAAQDLILTLLVIVYSSIHFGVMIAPPGALAWG